MEACWCAGNNGEGKHSINQSFHEPLSMGCDLHKHFVLSVFCLFVFTFSSLGEMGRVEGLELHNYPYPQGNETLVKSFFPVE